RWACIVCPSSSLREPGIAVASTLALPDALPICLDRLIDAALILDHAVDDLGEPVLVSLGQRGAVDVGVEAVIAELAHDAVDALARQLHLIQGLNGGQTGDRAGAALAAGQLRLGAGFFSLGQLSHDFGDGRRGAGRFGHEARPPRRRLRIEIRSRQARAAKPPLSPSLRRARAQACSSSSVVRMPLPIATPLRPRWRMPAAD